MLAQGEVKEDGLESRCATTTDDRDFEVLNLSSDPADFVEPHQKKPVPCFPVYCCMQDKRICIPVFIGAILGFIAIIVILGVVIWKNTDTPKSFLKVTPSNGHIHFTHGSLPSYTVYTNELHSKLKGYNVSVFGDKCQQSKSYGYDESKPCVLLSLDLPENVGIPHAAPQDMNNEFKLGGFIGSNLIFDNKHTPVACKPKSDYDKSSVNGLLYYPSSGISIDNLKSHTVNPPFVFVQFDKITKGVAVIIYCQVLGAKTDELVKYSTTFTIMVD